MLTLGSWKEQFHFKDGDREDQDSFLGEEVTGACVFEVQRVYG